MKFASFDLEIAKEIEEGVDDYTDCMPLGISCAAVALTGDPKVRFWKAKGQLSKQKCQKIVHDLIDIVKQGYKIVTWNGTGFDFRVLAFESGMYEECARLALHHVDMMLIVTFTKGWLLGLDTALSAAGIQSKLKEVELSDGSVLEYMKGDLVPALWEIGEYKAVLDYLTYDVTQPLEYAHLIEKQGFIWWTTKAGNTQKVKFQGMPSTLECFKIPEPDVSWMEAPKTRHYFVSWIPGADKINLPGVDAYEHFLDMYPDFI